MASWGELLRELKGHGSPCDLLRRKQLRRLHQLTGRNVIIYYSGWLQKGERVGMSRSLFGINDADKDGFMAAIHKLDPKKGLDLFLHTPGGEMAATESIVEYLRDKFRMNIRAVVPQMAMSAGTMIACACSSILMGRQSSLGPIDPQINGLPAHGILEEFERAKREIAKFPPSVAVWQPIIAKYHPTLIGECEKAIRLATSIVGEWLRTGMFDGMPDAAPKAVRVVTELGDHAVTMSHARHVSAKKARAIGLAVESLEENQRLQDAVLSTHHACMLTLAETPACKIIENHLGAARIEIVRIAKD
ncbi:MAG: S49 family peptidase [Verrucomicrobiales bacterium]|nr:S49 family peptidase [Verrucomicrobiales bacterium]